MGITNAQIYDRLGNLQSEHTTFSNMVSGELKELNDKLDTVNGRVRSNEKGLGIALDRTKRIGQEVDDHQKDQGAHGGATAKIHVSGNIKVALITFGGGLIAAGLLGKFFDILSAYLY